MDSPPSWRDASPPQAGPSTRRAGRIVKFGLVAAALAAAGVVSIRYASAALDSPRPAVRTVLVDSGPIVSSIRATGSVEALRNVRVASSVGGRLASLSVDVGAEVKKGQRLALIDNDDALQLDADRLDVASTEMELAQQQRQLDDLRADHAAGAEPRDRVTEAHERLLQTQLKLRRARLKLEMTRQRLADTVVSAPIDGTVVQVSAQPGEVVAAGAPLLALVDRRSLEILARLEQGDAPRVRAGQAARVSVEGVADATADEKVLRVEPALRQDSNADFLPVWISLSALARKVPVRPHQQVDVRLTLESLPSATRLPLEALVTRGGRKSVWVVESGRLQALPVEVGLVGDRDFEVASGLRPGMEVVVLEDKRLKEGDAVVVQRPAAR